MWVLKLGGSLLKSEDLEDTVKQLSDHGAGKLVIVPGGGIFADQVRLLYKELRLDEITAHRLALRAMEEFGELLVSLDPRFHAAGSIDSIKQWLARDQVPVWYPYEMVFDNPAIRAGGEITSDSLSYWLANQLQFSDLVLLKPTEPEEDNYSADYLSGFGFLDQAFRDMFINTMVTPWWLYYKHLSSFIDILDGKTPAPSGLRPITA